MWQHPGSGVTSPRETVLYEGQRRALAELMAAMDQVVRWILLVGPEGSGKSVILQSLRAELRGTATDVVFCDGFGTVEPEELMMTLRGQLLLPAPGAGLRRRRRADVIVESRASHTNPLVILVDNAHALSFKTLKLLAEVVRKTNPDRGWVCVVLVGQPSLRRHALRARRRLKYLSCSPEPLTPAEVTLHVDARLHTSPDRSLKILPEAIEEIAAVTGSWPGRIDAVCELILRRPAVRLTREVSAAVVKEVAERLALDPGSDHPGRGHRDPASPWFRRVAIVLVVLVPAGLGALAFPYVVPLVTKGVEWINTQMAQPEAPPAPPRPAEPPARTPRRAPTAATTTARTASGRSGAESAPRPEAVARPSAAAPAPPAPSREQIAAFLEGARSGRTDDVARLLAAGVSTEVRDAGGSTALMHAVQQGHADAVRVLLDKGAQVNARDRGGITPTMLAVINERPDALQALLRRGADVNARSGSGWTALTFAAWKGNPDLVRTLLQHGATRNVVDKQGWTPLDYAAAHSQLSADMPAVDINASPSSAARHAEVIPLLQGAERP